MNTMMNSFFDAFRKYAKFDGRASRPDYWWFQLAYLLIVVGFEALVFSVAGTRPLADILVVIFMLGALATVIPVLALTARRLHDTDRSGWWILIEFVPLVGPILLLVLLCLPSDPRTNRFG